MTNIQDLHLKNEILPLFDFVCNESSREVLELLLSEMPASIEEVRLRQDVIKGFLKNESPSLSYGKSEFNEVYGYVWGIRDRLTNLAGRSLTLHFFLAGSERNWERGRLGQLFLFFSKIHHAYFSSLGIDVFPDVFRRRLENINKMFSDLEVEKYQAIVRGRGLSIPEIVKGITLLGEKSESGEMEIFWKDFFLFEAYLSISTGIRRNHFTFPEFNAGAFAIMEFYHPLLKEPVKNSLVIRENVTLITGPNMSGKSTLLKSIGLCVYLAHLGLGVPAESCALPFFDIISIAINLNDDIKSGYSHFMTEIKTLKNVVVEAAHSQKCFAIFDELFRGTNVEDALAISKTTIKGLTKFPGSYFFISTHLHQLREAVSGNKVATHYIECKLERERPVFTYKLQNGWSDLKIGQIIFEQEGLNELLGGQEVDVAGFFPDGGVQTVQVP